MTVERKCGTCKYFEPAPLWRKGWCRHPLLYAPHQSHLVSEDDLDCDRGMTNYWEPAEQPARERLEEVTHEYQIVRPSESAGGDGGGGRFGTERERGSTMSFFRENPPGREPDQDEPTIPPFSSRPAGSSPFGSERSFTYHTDDRYWTDYLRIAAPVLGVILMLGLAWFWINQLLGRGEESIPTPTTTQVLTGPTPTPSGTPAGLIVITPGATNPTPTVGASPTPRTTIGPGATVVVANTDGAGVNLRAAPSTSADVIERLPEGTQLTVVGESVSADGYVWWPVKYSDQSGYVVADYLQLAQP
uniref:Uncharacterized protein n=1 Tax=Thermomicrobium roseum TaxID=500 RepID=A0A7C1XHK7_THERO